MKKNTISIIATAVLAFGCLGTAIAAPSDRWSSKGIILFPGPDGTEGTADDIKFDSADLDTIYSEVADGKTAIANAIKNDAGLNLADPADTVSNIYTFQELVTGINPWDDIASGVGKLTYDSSTGTYSARATQSPEYAAVNSIESLDQAIARDNISYLNDHIGEYIVDNYVLSDWFYGNPVLPPLDADNYTDYIINYSCYTNAANPTCSVYGALTNHLYSDDFSALSPSIPWQVEFKNPLYVDFITYQSSLWGGGQYYVDYYFDILLPNGEYETIATERAPLSPRHEINKEIKGFRFRYISSDGAYGNSSPKQLGFLRLFLWQNWE